MRFKKGDRFRIDWDKLIRTITDKESRDYQKSQKEKYGNDIFIATSVSMSKELLSRKVPGGYAWIGFELQTSRS